MNKETEKRILSNALSEIDLRYVEEADRFVAPANQQTARRPWALRLLPVACVCAIIAIGALIVPILKSGNLTTPPATEQQTVGAVAYSGEYPWRNAQSLMGFGSSEKKEAEAVQTAIERITDGKYASYRAGHVIDETYVGEKLGEVTVQSYWYHVWQQQETDTVYIEAEVYAIDRVSPDAAICVRYLEKGVANTTTHYYIYTNPAWEGASWQSFCTSFDLASHLSPSIAQASVFTRSESGEELCARYSVREEDCAQIRALLLSLTGERKALYTADELEAYIAGSREQGQLFLTAYTVANPLFAVQIFDNGYLLLVREGEAMLFEIGWESAQSLLLCLKQAPIVSVTPSNDATVQTRVETSAAFRPA